MHFGKADCRGSSSNLNSLTAQVPARVSIGNYAISAYFPGQFFFTQIAAMPSQRSFASACPSGYARKFGRDARRGYADAILYDSEFKGFDGVLIPIALVPEDASVPFCAALHCGAPTDWIQAHVLPVLNTPSLPRCEVSTRSGAQIGNNPGPVVIADWPEDIAHVALLMVTGPGACGMHRRTGCKCCRSTARRSGQLSLIGPWMWYFATEQRCTGRGLKRAVCRENHSVLRDSHQRRHIREIQNSASGHRESEAHV